LLDKTLVNTVLVLAILLSLGVSAAHGAPPAQEGMAYTVKWGDYLWALAKEYLGDGHAYRDIVAATNAKHDEDPSFAQIVNPDLIITGWKLLIPGAVAAPTAKALDTELASQLQAALEAAVEGPDTQWPGAVLHVSSPELGTWAGAAGLGNAETNTPMRPHDRFRAGSLTIPVVSVVILQLVEEGRFSLDDPITAVLPESVTGKFAHSDQMTVRMLLNHTAGTAEFMDTAMGEILADFERIWTAEEFLDFAAAQEPMFAPGEAQHYSNTNYLLLGLVIEEATGRPWREEIRERVFEPLNLENTLLPEPADATIPRDFAHGYNDLGGGVMDLTEVANASVVGAPGGQSLITTAEDLARFMDAVLAGELFQKAGTLDEMLTFVDFSEDHPLSVVLVGYGLGLAQAAFGSGIEGIGHSGDTQGGYTSFVFHLPAQNVTISGAVNRFDPGAPFLQLVPRALEVLVPGFTMPEAEVGSTPPITDAEDNVIPGSIASLEKVTLGGIEQWILIRGADTTKPVLLWLHGGPGTPEMPWVGMFQPPELEADFVVVQWDQRGTGKSYSKDLSEEDMRAENFVSDTLELTDVLRERFGQEKIFLFGHSWGSALGFMTIMEDSDPYYAYIAAAEAADWIRRQTMSYEWVLTQAREHNDTEVVQVLESVQPFEPMNLEHITAKNQFLDRYRGGDLYTEGLWDAALEYVLSGKSPEYTSADIEKTLAGIDFSRQTVGAEAAQSGYSLFREFPVSPIPVHFFAGRHDHQTPGELAEEYYNFLEAPAKSFTWFENSGHTMIWDEPDKTAQELIRIANETLNP